MNKNPYTNKEKSLTYRSFEIGYKIFGLPLMKFLVKKMGGDKEAAEEVFSQTIEAGLKGWYTFENKSSFFTWICRIGLNKIADYYRDQINQRSKIIVPFFGELANIKDSHLNPEEKTVLEDIRGKLRECLDMLPPDKRQLLQFRYWEEMTLKEIATFMGTTERAIEGRLYRARLELRAIVVDKYPDLTS